ncbi:MAG: hypothetical protein BZ138_03570, partial [Methanosphaera sp. rholeuAM270]
MSKNGGQITLSKKYIFLTCVLILLISCFSVVTAAEISSNDTTTTTQTSVTTKTTHAIDNVQSSNNNDNYNSGLDTSKSATTNSIGEKNTSQILNTTTTNNDTTTEKTVNTNAKAIQKINKENAVKTATEYTATSWYNFKSIVASAPENAIIHFVEGQTYYVNSDDTFWNQNRVLRNLTLIGHGAIVDGGNQYRFLEIGGQRDRNIFFTFNVSNLTFKDCGSDSVKYSMGGVIYGIHKPTVYISNCTFMNSQAPSGGAITIHRGNLTIKDCVFINSSANSYGAIRIATDYANLTIDNVTFIDSSTGSFGGVIYANTQGSINITNSNFINNTVNNTDSSNSKGSVIYVDIAENMNVENNNFTNNIAGDEGAIYIANSNYGQLRTIINNTFVNNTARNGAAISVNRAINLLIENNTFLNNSVTDNGGAIFMHDGVKAQLTTNVFENNTALNGGSLSVNKDVDLQLNRNVFKNSNATNGAAIYSEGTINSTNTTFTNLTATNGGALYLTTPTADFTGNNDTYINNSATNGGAVYVNSNAKLVSNKGQFKENNATLGGVFYIENNGKFNTNYDLCENNIAVRGGVFYINQTNRAVESEGSNYTNNKATEYGGVLYLERGSVDSEDETYLNNSALIGGAVYNLAGTVDSINNKLINNTALYGGAAFNSGNGTIIKKLGTDINNNATVGGAIYNNGTLISTDGSFENNTAVIGGAVYNGGTATAQSNSFNANNATLGGAVYNNATISSISNTFIANNATNGGALVNNGTITGNGNNYYNNTASENGGAAYICEGYSLSIQQIEFEGNVAGQNGGAIYTEDNVIITSSHDVKYTNNTAVRGGVVYLSDSSNLTTSADEFISNYATEGGAIYAASNNNVTIKTKTTFDSNNATLGGAIYINDSAALDSNDAVYKNGHAINGSAIFAQQGSQLTANGNQFLLNDAENGAVYIEEGVVTSLSNGKYTDNTAENGAAIYTKSDLNTNGLNFTSNNATLGGAIYLDGVNYNSNQDTFTSNNATLGGAIYVDEDSTANISSSAFNTNKATDGGAIYLDGDAIVNTTGTTYRQNDAINGGVMYVSQDANVNVLGGDSYTANTATNGGVFYNQGNINSTGNTYSEGIAQTGGVLYNAPDANFTADHDAFTSNNAVDGAVLVNYGNVTITHSTIDSNTGTNSVILNNKVLTLTDNTVSKNIVTADDGYVILNNVDTATIVNNLFDSNTDFERDMLLGSVQPQSITGNTYIDNFLNDTMEVPGVIEIPIDVLEYFINITVNLNNIYNDTVRNGTVYFYDESFRRVGEGVVVDGNASVRIYRPVITQSITNVTVVYNSLSKHYQDISLKSELHLGKTTQIVIVPINQTYVDEKINVTVYLYETDGLQLMYDANITVYINGTEYTGNTTDKGYIVIEDISFDRYGNYPMNATFEGNKTHAESTVNGTIEIIKIPTFLNMTLPSDVHHPDDEGYINVTLHDARDNSTLQVFNITLNITGKEGYVALPDENGKISYLFQAYENGHIQVVASVHESSDKYAIPAEVDGELFIERYHTHFHSNTSAIIPATDTNVTFTLYDTDHNLLKNKNITITITENGVSQTPYNVTTDASGQYTLSYILHPSDDVTITAFCTEDYKYRNSSLPVHLVAEKNTTWVALSPENTFINKTTTIRINLQENGNMPFTGTVNLRVGEYGPVEVEVTNGEIVYTTPWTWPERQYVDVYVSYLGDEHHTDTSATSTFTVFRAATVTSVGVTDNLDTKTVIVGNVTSEGYPPINTGNVTLTAEYTNFTTGLRETIDLGNATVIDGKFNLTTDKLMVLEEDYGRYVITATYNTNNVFYESSADTGTVRITSVRNTTISIVANPRTLVGTEEAILFYLYDSKGEALSNKTLIITINGTEYVDYEVSTNNAGFVLIYAIFDEVGLNNITARFAGDDYYNSSDNNETITVKQRTVLTLTVPATVHVYDNVTINVTLKDIDGKPLVGESVILNDHEHQGTFITDENGTIIVDGFYSTYGTKNITAEYRGSLFYINSATNDIIQVLRLDTILNVTSESPVLIGNITKLEGYLTLHNGTALANKTVLMYINDATDAISLKTDENGYYCYNYTTEFSGRNTVKVVFETDDTYWGFTDTQSFIVKKYITDVSVEADRLIKVGDTTTITGILEDEFGNRIPNKVINLTVNGQVVAHDTTDNDGNYQFTFTQPESGIYNITVNFTGDDKYLKSFDTYQIKVDKIITHLNITGTSPVNYGDKITVEAVLFDEYGNILSRENLTVYINQSEITNITTRGFGDADYSYIADAIGLQNITFNYNGTTKYYGSNNTYQVNVLKLYTHFDNLQATNVEIGSNSTISGYLIDESGRGLVNAEFNVTLNGNETTTKTIKTDNNGHFIFQYNSTAIGINNVTLTYDGNYSQEPVEDYITFNVDKLDVFIDINVTNVKAGNTTILVNVTDEDGNPIPEGTVIVYYDEGGEAIGNGTVGPDGTVEISIPLEPGIHDLLIVYNGTEELYKYANKIVTINVPGYVLNITINDINDTKVRNSTNITGFLFYEDAEQNPIVGENVTIFVDGVEIANVTTGENGNYSYVYNATTSGFKEVLVVFLGNETHSRVEATSNFTVEKINTTVSIESIENTTVDYKVVINGTLVDEFDIIVPNAIVTIEINGVNYTNTTDENGKYFYEYTTSVVGLNNITVYYDGNNTFNATVSNTTFNVTAHPTNVTANITNPRPGNNLIIITVTDENSNNVTTGKVTIKEDETELGSGIIVNGELVTAITLKPGEHTLNIEYEGITNYLRNSTTYTVTIPKYNTT